jgi:hypothetical protein
MNVGLGPKLAVCDEVPNPVILAYGVFGSKTFIESIGQTDQARGLITFLFAFATIGIAILMAIALMWMEREDVEARFAKAKDLLAILVGVLGTIVGFYFGSAGGTTPKNLVVSAVRLLPPSVEPGARVAVSTRASGGAAPYQYDIIVTDPSNKLTTTELNSGGKTSATGEISDQISIPKDASVPNLDVKVSVLDSKGAQAVSNAATLKITPSLSPSVPVPSTGGAKTPNEVGR